MKPQKWATSLIELDALLEHPYRVTAAAVCSVIVANQRPWPGRPSAYRWGRVTKTNFTNFESWRSRRAPT
jgi:hypothetical protein